MQHRGGNHYDLNADCGKRQDQRSVGLAKFDRKTVGMPHYAHGRPKDDGKKPDKGASSGSACVVSSLSWLPTATEIAAVASPISSGNSARIALPNGCVFFAC